MDNSEDLSTTENQELLQKLKKLIPEDYRSQPETYLFKFLLARGRDPQKAAVMFENTANWRKKMGVNTMPSPNCIVVNHIRGYQGFPDQDFDVRGPNVPEGWADFFFDLGGGCYHKTDKEGSPLFIELPVTNLIH